MGEPILVWFRRDLRLADQMALAAAARSGPVIPVYILDDETPKHRIMGGASRWWLNHSLASLDANLRAAGSRANTLSISSLIDWNIKAPKFTHSISFRVDRRVYSAHCTQL